MVGGAAERFALTYACVLVVNGFAVSWTAAGLESRWRASGVAGDGGALGTLFCILVNVRRGFLLHSLVGTRSVRLHEAQPTPPPYRLETPAGVSDQGSGGFRGFRSPNHGVEARPHLHSVLE